MIMMIVVVIMMRMKMIIVIIVINDNQIYRVYEQYTHTPYFKKLNNPPPLQLSIFWKVHRVFFYVLLTVHLDTSVQ